MNLVIQGEDIATADLKELHRLSRGAAIERISDEAFRITRADPATKPQVAEHAERAKLDFGFVEDARVLRDFGLLAMDMDSRSSRSSASTRSRTSPDARPKSPW
ncbi:MAG TPA: DUF4072 domain-containing protein [Usitatibacter sp.]|nr:DUF4072 domain-containing protein [Usitatibacter sp.]